jgi:Short C-terminal domain
MNIYCEQISMETGIGAELETLKKLHNQGVLSDAEFTDAKAKLLNMLGPENNTGTGVNLLGKAANRWVDFNIVTYVVSAIGAVLFLIFFIIPQWNDMKRKEAEFNASFKASEQRIEEAHQDMAERRKKFDQDFDKQSREMEPFRKKNFSN